LSWSPKGVVVVFRAVGGLAGKAVTDRGVRDYGGRSEAFFQGSGIVDGFD